MEQDSLMCAKFIIDINAEGYYVDADVLIAAKNIINDYVSENDCSVSDYDDCDDDW